LAFEDFPMHLGAMHIDPRWRGNTEFHLGTVEFEDVQGNVIPDGDDFAYSAA
jgi:hypothetical protein